MLLFLIHFPFLFLFLFPPLPRRGRVSFDGQRQIAKKNRMVTHGGALLLLRSAQFCEVELELGC